MGWIVPFTSLLSCRSVCVPLLLALCLLPRPTAAQNGSVGFWELSTRQEAFMLNLNPSADEERYSTLRADFIRFGCGRRLTEQPLEGDHPAHRKTASPRNLICTLPGKYSIPIVILACYPARPVDGGVSNGWPEAVLLPIMFQALQAQPRTFTYVFAELSGEDGERAFLEHLHDYSGSAPVAFIALEALGTGVPHFATAGPRSDRQVRQILESEAWRIATLQGFGATQQYEKNSRELNRSVFPNRLAEPLKQTPHVLVFGQPGEAVTPQLFHRDFEFLAFYLCALDVKLDPLSGTAD
ncbi:MAG TPA: hypothetical protein VKT75_17960 [Acidobacteriaceae bacterium]|nr:hypothetical protein [Acidobacteriaceae bacterium]